MYLLICLFIYLYFMCFACVHVCILCVCLMPVEAVGHPIPLDCSYRQLWATIWLLELEPGTSLKATSALNLGAISSTQQFCLVSAEIIGIRIVVTFELYNFYKAMVICFVTDVLIIVCLLCVAFVSLWVHGCCSSCAEVRGPHGGLRSLLFLCAFWGLNSGHQP